MDRDRQKNILMYAPRYCRYPLADGGGGGGGGGVGVGGVATPPFLLLHNTQNAA